MSSHNAVSTSAGPDTKKVPMPKGGRLWYVLKYMECVLVVSCLLMLVLTQYLHVVVDDFTAVKPKNTTETTNTSPNQPPPKSKRANEAPKIISKESSETSTRIKLRDEHFESELMMNGDTHIGINKNLKRVKKVSDKEELGKYIKRKAKPISLNDLLIMFPCSTTLLMVIVMEILGEVFKDPLSKLSNLILIFLAILLAITLFTVSLLSYLRSPRVTLILTSILSASLVIVELINFILLQLS